MKEKTEEKNITVNRKARHEYSILQTVEAGIVLVGTEVKALRQGKANLVDSYSKIQHGEIWLVNSNISEYTQGNINNHEPRRERKLLLNKSEIRKLTSKINEKGLTLIPLRLYFKQGKVRDIAKRDFERDQDRKIKY
jgi:SsrA-binding protein